MRTRGAARQVKVPITEEQKNGETQRNIPEFIAFGPAFRYNGWVVFTSRRAS